MMPLDPRCVNRDSTGRNRGPPDEPVTSGTAPLLHQGPLRPRQSYGRWCQCGAPVNAGRVPVNRRSAGTPPPFTGALPGLNRGVTVSLPAYAGIAPVSAGGVTGSIGA
ncbi:hypothetical protein DPMN_157162 [Dreissena polymorpha]|uniref:Uncharacterized protein n=1 Tax=Dreissena polymorpha TaxID=45954 RepID=A0A9D4IA19_DREPO|nr:hypothetical protein DPMN_077023 [Dreissena polymorpha]KAH3752367.1 hypothetical protein DPMN_186984 [Dreissena polymorpha]KAH3779360.1 hypothetical protein DPMN_157162 [Dreissena polymorpha]